MRSSATEWWVEVGVSLEWVERFQYRCINQLLLRRIGRLFGQWRCDARAGLENRWNFEAGFDIVSVFTLLANWSFFLRWLFQRWQFLNTHNGVKRRLPRRAADYAMPLHHRRTNSPTPTTGRPFRVHSSENRRSRLFRIRCGRARRILPSVTENTVEYGGGTISTGIGRAGAGRRHSRIVGSIGLHGPMLPM